MRPPETDLGAASSLALAITGIGSVPFTTIDEALEFVFTTTPVVPYLPQLPLLGPGYEMLGEPFSHCPELFERSDSGGIEVSDLEELERHLGEPPLPPFFNRFLLALPSSARAVKVQCVGPATLLRFTTYRGTPLAMISGGAEVFCDYLARYVERIVEKLLTTKLPVFFLLDEPLLETNPFTGILLRRLEKTWAIPGVHSCGATGAGLSLTPPPEIIALDCSGQVAPLRALLAGVHPHTASGRRLALGLSPRDSAAEIRTLKWEILSAFSETETVFDPERVLLTPPCGLAFQTPDHARAVFAALARLREELLTETGTIKDTATEGA